MRIDFALAAGLAAAIIALPDVASAASVAAGAAHSAVVKDTDGTLWAWGSNGNGRLGDNTTIQRSTPIQVGTSGNWLTSVTMVAAGAAHTLALKSDGTVWAFGSNSDGQLGDDTTASHSPIPVPVVGITGTVVGIAAGDYHSLAWTSDGKLYSWGRNSNGQLGLDDLTLRRKAIQVTFPRNPVPLVTHASAGSAHSLAVTSDTTAWGFGLNTWGRLGDGTTSQRQSPVQVRNSSGGILTGFSKVAAGGTHSLAVMADATGLGWGGNGKGQIGDGSTSNRLNPVAVSNLDSLTALSAGANHSVAIESDGTIHTFGDNTDGQLGDGGVASYSTVPALVTGVTDAVAAVAASNHTIAVTSNGVVWVFGRNGNSQLGDGTTENRLSPISISGPNFDWKVATPYFSLASGTYTTTKQVDILSVTPSATIRYTTDGSEPNGSSQPFTQTLSILVSTTLKARAFLASRPDSNTGTAVYELKAVAPTLTPGTGTYATDQLVQMTTPTPGATIRYTTNGSEPTETSTPYIAQVPVAASQTLKAKAFKDNWTASDTTSRTYTMKVGTPSFAPVGGTYNSAQEVTVTTVTSSATLHYTTSGFDPLETDPIVASGSTVLIDHSATLKAKGWRSGWTPSDVTAANYFLTLGSVATPTFTPPAGSYTSSQEVSIASATPGAMIRYTLDGSTPDLQSPIFAGEFTLSGTTTVKAIAFHDDMNPSAIATAVYTLNLGAVATPTLSVPSGAYTTNKTVTVSCSTSGATIHYTTNGAEPAESDAAIASGGTLDVDKAMILKAKGFHNSMPASATARRDYIITGALVAGGNHSLALKADGTVWAFGRNLNGQLGVGDTTNRPSPTQINDLSGVIAVAAGESHSLALMPDGSVKAWGLNSYGQLGDGTEDPQKNSPVTVSGLSGIIAIAAGENHSLALKADNTVLAWGWNFHGQLGIGPTPIESSSPLPVTGLTNIIAIAAHSNHSLALKADGTIVALKPAGTVVAFGHNSSGQLGDGTNTPRNTPVPMLGPKGITGIAAGHNYSLALKTSGLGPGTLWATGYNADGRLGDGTDDSRNIPLSGVSDVVSLEAGDAHTLAITSDGALWSWGKGSTGQLGDGSTVDRYFPARIFFTPEQLTMDGGIAHSLALGAEGRAFGFGDNTYGQLGQGSMGGTFNAPVQLPNFLLVSNSWLVSDSDQDGLSNASEYRIGTDPLNPDTNGDGISDGVEFQLNKRPFDPDSDGDGLSNADEFRLGTDPFVADTDGDGVVDGLDAFPLDSTHSQAVPNPGDTTPPVITLQEPTNAIPQP